MSKYIGLIMICDATRGAGDSRPAQTIVCEPFLACLKTPLRFVREHTVRDVDGGDHHQPPPTPPSRRAYLDFTEVWSLVAKGISFDNCHPS